MQETLILRSTTVEHSICQFAHAGRASNRLCSTAVIWSASSSVTMFSQGPGVLKQAGCATLLLLGAHDR